jgi:hypothetical protein
MEFFEPLYETEYEQVNAHHDNDIYEPESFANTIINAIDTNSTIQWILFFMLIFIIYWIGNNLFSIFFMSRTNKRKQNHSFII